MSIFKACDIRGKFGADLTAPLMAQIGRGMATILRRDRPDLARPPTLLVAGDVRISTPPLKRSFIDGATASGADVLDLGQVPTPLARFAFRELRPDALAIVTASHNPPEYNGLKLQFSARPVTPEQINRLRQLVERRDFDAGRGHLQVVDLVDRYRQWILRTLEAVPKLRVVVDAGNGCYSELAPELMAKLGFEVARLFCEIDGRFPNRSPNSAIAANLAELCRQVRKQQADFGVAFDGDGDRVAFVDERGRPVPYDKAVVLLARDVLAREGAGLPPERRKVVYEINCSQAVPDELRRLAATPVIERAGHAFITARMVDESALFGGEVSGHFFFGTLEGSDDGLYAAIRMGHVIASGRQGAAGASSMAALVDAVPQYCATPVQRIPFDADAGHAAVRAIRAAAEGKHEVIDIDGIRVQYPQGWGLARVSITEPVISLRFEAYRPDDLEPLVNEFLRPAPVLLEEVRRRLFHR